MSRNAQRIKASAPTPLVPKEDVEQKLTINIPTTFVVLPSEGKYYPEDHPLHNKEVIEIKHMTTKEEEILNSQSLIQRGLVVDRLLKNIIVDKTIPFESILLGDKNAILVAARSDAYGDDYGISIACPYCMEQNEIEIPLSDFVPKENKTPVDVSERGYPLITLPKTKAKVEVRFMNSHDEKTIAEYAKKSKKMGIENSLTLQYKQFVVSVNGDESGVTIGNFVGSMPAFDSRHLRKTYQELMPDLDMRFDFSCQFCGEEQEMEVPITVKFFWP